MNKTSCNKLAEVVKDHLKDARVLVLVEGGYGSMQWINREGNQIAYWQLGIPSGCLNNPFTRHKTGSGYFSIDWENLRIDYSGYSLSGYWELEVSDVLWSWLNTEPFIAVESSYVGQHITRGTWHAGKNRWMFGPKQNRQ